MNVAYVIILGTLCSFILVKPIYAESDTSIASNSAIPQQESQISSTGETIQSIKNFIVSIDSIVGGFVFSTPEDLFSNTVHMQDGAIITNLSIFRNMFIALSIPMTAIIIFWVGGSNMSGGSVNFLKPFIGRLIYYTILAITISTFLTYTIKIENALTTSILNAPVLSQKETKLSGFMVDYWNTAMNQISSGQSSPESIGIPNIGWTNFFQSLEHAIIEMSLFLIGIVALVLGIMFILTQFVLRFLGLLFLSLIFPLALPFVITEKTEGIFYTYLRVWFTFLIHQPAFALGYIMIMMIVRSILTSQGANFSLMFLYVSSLFFLGTVNVLTARIFTDAWTASASNLEAGVLGATLLNATRFSTRLIWNSKNHNNADIKSLERNNSGSKLSKRSPTGSHGFSESQGLNKGARGGIKHIDSDHKHKQKYYNRSTSGK